MDRDDFISAAEEQAEKAAKQYDSETGGLYITMNRIRASWIRITYLADLYSEYYNEKDPEYKRINDLSEIVWQIFRESKTRYDILCRTEEKTIRNY